MKVAAVQMEAELANVNANLKIAERLAESAFRDGAEMVIIPEFFTTAMGFHPKMLDSVRKIDGKPLLMLKNLAAKYKGIIGGSFIASRGQDAYNTFILVFPDGKMFFHDKDQPTMWENCYYIAGNDDGVLETPLGNIGVALCWELVRSRTPKRLLNRVDMVVGGSCWWTLPEAQVPGFPLNLDDQVVKILVETPLKLARMLGVHVIHASHAGKLDGKMPLIPGFQYKSHYCGETQIVDGSGKILERMKHEEGEGYITADIDPKQKWNPYEPIPNRFWIPQLPLQIRFIWFYQNLYGKRYYYPKIAKRYWKKRNILH